MTISSVIRKAGPFIGNGGASTFAFAFKVFAATDLLVVTAETDTGAETTLTLNSDYSVALNADQDGNPGGSITLLAAPLATGFVLVITTAIPQLQGTAVTNSGGFYPDVFNAALDLLTVYAQQLREVLDRSLSFPVTDAATAALPPAPSRAGKIFAFDANGNPSLITVAPGGIIPGAQAAAGAVDSVNKDFTFTAAAGATPIPLVFAGGVFQSPGTDYVLPVFVSGSSWKITFIAAPPSGPITVLLLA
jgi:hypothetical protein